MNIKREIVNRNQNLKYPEQSTGCQQEEDYYNL
jgi:hypothetical protein